MVKETETKPFCVSAKHFAEIIFQKGANYLRIDIVFDRYSSVSIEGQTRQRHSETYHPVLHGTVPLSPNLSNILALPENKADLAQFLSAGILKYASMEKNYC